MIKLIFGFSLEYLVHGYRDVIFSCMLLLCSTESFNFTCFFLWSSHFVFFFFFFCSQKYNKKLWNWVLINLGPVSNCPFSACLCGFVHVCKFVCSCLKLWSCHAPFPHLYSNFFSWQLYSCIQCCFGIKISTDFSSLRFAVFSVCLANLRWNLQLKKCSDLLS